MNRFHRAGLALLSLLSACANYDFAQAELPDGSYDVPRLIADLEASGEDSLHDFTWLPLLHLSLTEFKASAYNFPKGYTLSRTQGYGPLFFLGSKDERVVGQKGEAIEQNDLDWFGWGVLYHDLDQRIETESGPRYYDRGQILLLWGWDHPLYVTGPAQAASRPAGQ